MNVFLWSVIFLIGVYDAREHRIPNYLLGVFFLINILDVLYFKRDLTLFYSQCLAFFVIFLISIFCFISGWMAPGDVKLLSVVGFVTGYGSLISLFFWIGVSSVFLGIMYWMINHLLLFKHEFWLRDLSSKLLLIMSNSTEKSILINSRDEKLVMPFAPVVVLGLALNQYMKYSV